MIEIKIPKEIRDYKETLFLGLNLRQIICLVIVFSINVPLYLFIKPYIGDELASWVVMFTGVPLFLVGFIKFDGMPFEQYFKIMIRFNFIVPRKRKFKVENIFTIINDEQMKNDERQFKSMKTKKGGKINDFKIKK